MHNSGAIRKGISLQPVQTRPCVTASPVNRPHLHHETKCHGKLMSLLFSRVTTLLKYILKFFFSYNRHDNNLMGYAVNFVLSYVCC